jgi:excinuclease ABC subunit A
VIKLLNCLRRLVNEGHSIFLIEHDFDVLRNCDWIVELGPGAGESGGKIIYNGLASKLAGLCTPWGELLLPGHLVDK